MRARRKTVSELSIESAEDFRPTSAILTRRGARVRRVAEVRAFCLSRMLSPAYRQAVAKVKVT